MEKRKAISTALAIALALPLLFVTGCGTGDKGGVDRINVASHVTTSEPGGGGAGGGGGGNAAGVCVMTSTYYSACYENYTKTYCDSLNVSTSATFTFRNNATCPSLGYTNCSNSVCIK